MTDNKIGDGSFNYMCSGCGEFVDSDEDMLHSGCVLRCPECGGETVVDFCSVDRWVEMAELRTKLRKHVEVLQAMLDLMEGDSNTLYEKLKALVKELGD
jgi:DNA-directed RNA polymerase subunit RPC12/RpoP